jgi:hypothetical protein
MRPRTATTPQVTVCGACRRPFLLPVEVLTLARGERYAVRLRCADCGDETMAVHDDAELELLDRALDAGAVQLHAALDAFAAALRGDRLLPDHF